MKINTSIHKSEFRAIIVTMTLICAGVLLPPFLSGLQPTQQGAVVEIYPLVVDTLPGQTDTVFVRRTSTEGSHSKIPKYVGYSNRNTTRYHKPDTIDINIADTTQWKSLRGIGSVLSARIVKFRDKLGGFHRIDQVGQTYGLPPETFSAIQPYLKLETPHETLDFETVNVQGLGRHPYISWDQARAIVRERRSGGAIGDILSKVGDEAWVAKVRPYFN